MERRHFAEERRTRSCSSDGPTLPAALVSAGVGQIGILVPSLEEGLRMYASLESIDSWCIYAYSPESVPLLEYRGHEGVFSIRIALGGRDPQVELVESLAGPSIYEEWIVAHGYGLHHLGFYVASLEAVIAAMADSGFPMIQMGSGYGVNGDGGFAYFDLSAAWAVIVEAIEVPVIRREPEATWSRGDGFEGPIWKRLRQDR